MQNIEQKLVLRGAIGENASEGEPTLVIGMKARLLVRSVNESGTASAPANISDVASWKFILAEDWNPATNPCYIADAEWNPATATWTILLDGTRTAEMLSALGTEGVIDIGCEIAGLPENGTWDKPLFVAQWTMPMRNRRDSDGAPTPLDPSPVTPHAAQHAVGGVDPVTPASIGAASVADATLTDQFGEWEIVAAEPITLYWSEVGWIPSLNGQDVGMFKGDESSLSLSWSAPSEASYDIKATRTKSYRLGSQSNKPLAPARNYALKSELSPVKAVKKNGTALTPDENGAVNVDVTDKANSTALAAAFTAKAYAAGDLATYNGLLYRCKSAYTSTAQSTKPDSDTTHWEASVVAVLLDGKVSKFGDTMTGPLTVYEWGVSSLSSSNGSIMIFGNTIQLWRGLKESAPDGYLRLPFGNDMVVVMSNIAPDFLPSVQYEVNSLVNYDGALYRCTASHTGAWSDNDFTAATVEDVLALLRTAIAAKYTKPSGGIPASDLAAGALRYALATQTTTASTTITTDDTLSATLTDRAINTIAVPSGVTTLNLTFPAAVSGYARDFFVRIVTAGTDLATVAMTADSDAADIEIGADDLANWNKAGTHLVLFTEIAAGKWLASKRFEEASS